MTSNDNTTFNLHMNNDDNTYDRNSNDIEEDQPSQDTNTSNNDYNLSQESEPPYKHPT
jgi:hypothetical protein